MFKHTVRRISSWSIAIKLLVVGLLILPLLAGSGPNCGVEPGASRDLIPRNADASFRKVQFNYTGNFAEIPKGKSVVSFGIVINSTWTLTPGSLNVRGKITPLVAGSELPNQIRIVARKKNAQGQVQLSKLFDVTVNSDGTILIQSFPIAPAVPFLTTDVLDLSLIPRDRKLPFCQANLTITFVPPPGT